MTDYVDVSWTGEPIVVEKLQQMATNDRYLLESKPTTVLKHNGITRNKGMKILAGSALFQPSLTWATNSEIYFGNYFSAGCYPIVTPVIYGYPQTATYIHAKGLGGTQLPDHRGFGVYVRSNEREGRGLGGTLTRPYYIGYIAVGW